MDEKQKEFLSRLAGVLEVDSISPADDYRLTPLWGSLTCFALKVTIMQHYGRDVPLKDLDSFPDVKTLMENVLK
ncbi:MAG: hypothetical protein IKL02_07185 [Kiritimatiellae bacterium]|nr:hypothetical protein [Kiritimatiellia bacterium]MBR3777356.1 hypothetical protein [Kiritimatiellia bacterium]